jgi:hypothetical protein
MQSPAYHADEHAGRSNYVIQEDEEENLSENEDDANMEVGSQNLGGGGQLQGSNPHSHKDDYTSRGSEEEEKQVDFNSFK